LIKFNLFVASGPGKVENVRVFLYTPLIADRNTRNGLVTWNNVAGPVSNFNVKVVDYSTGMDLDASGFLPQCSMGVNIYH